MWIPKTASAELDNFPDAEVKGRFSLSGGEFSMTINNVSSVCVSIVCLQVSYLYLNPTCLFIALLHEFQYKLISFIFL